MWFMHMVFLFQRKWLVTEKINMGFFSISTGIVMGVGVFGPALGFGLGAIFSNVYVTMESMYYPFKNIAFAFRY